MELITQMYFPNHPLNKSDSLLNQKSSEERAMMIASKVNAAPETYQYTIVLQKV